MNFPESYRAQVFNAIERIDTSLVGRVIDVFREARDNGRHIFVCGNGGSASTASHFPGDVFMALSGSGNSPNVVAAMEYANSVGCTTIALTGRDGGKLGPLAGIHIHVNEPHMGRIEDAHMVVCHMICYYFMERIDEVGRIP